LNEIKTHIFIQAVFYIRKMVNWVIRLCTFITSNNY
ncbi:unnamed protein product, partial [marine sediment metagenome]